jgi:hypothetical protein
MPIRDIEILMYHASIRYWNIKTSSVPGISVSLEEARRPGPIQSRNDVNGWYIQAPDSWCRAGRVCSGLDHDGAQAGG